MKLTNMLDLDALQAQLCATRLGVDALPLIETTRQVCANLVHGDLPRWQAAVSALPEVEGAVVKLTQDCVTVATADPLTGPIQDQLFQSLRALCPWRKGPYSIGGIYIDTEWRSDWKWQRVEPHLSSLSNRRVLDVGCGSGYHVWRMAGAGADVVIGIDPGLLFNMQFKVLQHFVQSSSTAVLPLRLEQLPPLGCFDTVFSMGVLYHRRDPAQHLAELKQAMAPGAELVLETLVLPADPTGDSPSSVLQPAERYARMRNVWQIPATPVLVKWLEQAGFRDVRVVSQTRTSIEEQRSTDWMQFESLAESLHPDDPRLTIEGYPAPHRAILVASH